MHLPWFRVAVSGLSMVPALAPGEWLLVRRGTPPREGAVVVVRLHGRLAVKRVARIEGNAVHVAGDNTEASTDGTVAREDVLGEVRWRYYPVHRAGRVR